MRRAVAVCAAWLFCASVAAAQSKVAIINLREALLATADMKKASAGLQAKYRGKQEQLEKAQRELQDLQTQLQNSLGKLSQQGQQDLENRAARKQKDVQRMGEDLQQDVDMERNDILTGAGQRMQMVVKKLADERGIDVVIDVQNAMYWKEAIEITKEATAAYDKAHPAGGTSPPPAASKKP